MPDVVVAGVIQVCKERLQGAARPVREKPPNVGGIATQEQDDRKGGSQMDLECDIRLQQVHDKEMKEHIAQRRPLPCLPHEQADALPGRGKTAKHRDERDSDQPERRLEHLVHHGADNDEGHDRYVRQVESCRGAVIRVCFVECGHHGFLSHCAISRGWLFRPSRGWDTRSLH